MFEVDDDDDDEMFVTVVVACSWSVWSLSKSALAALNATCDWRGVICSDKSWWITLNWSSVKIYGMNDQGAIYLEKKCSNCLSINVDG